MLEFSVFTPTHDPRWLLEAYRSLVAQTYQNWEWVLVPNGDTPAEIPAEVKADPRVKIVPSRHKNIGALKRLACTVATGNVFVELDHDDALTPTALSTLAAAVARDGPGFFFSDFVSYYPNGVSEQYSNFHGWQAYDVEVDGRPFQAQRAFGPSARSLCDIAYAPNHVRAWHRDAYYKAGGHDASMLVGDDHDLVCRTYLADVPFVHVPACLYLYRRVLSPKAENSFVTHNEAVQKASLLTMNKYLHRLAAREARRRGLRLLDLGGAHNCPAGYESVDVVDAAHLFEVGSGPLPFPDDSVGVVRAFDFFEHVPRDRFVGVMNDLYRVLAPGGWVLSGTPSSDGRGAFQDPTHVNYLNQNSFWYYCDRNFAKYVKEINCRFQGVRVWTEFPSEFHKKFDIPYVYADLMAMKGQRVPGPALI